MLGILYNALSASLPSLDVNLSIINVQWWSACGASTPDTNNAQLTEALVSRLARPHADYMSPLPFADSVEVVVRSATQACWSQGTNKWLVSSPGRNL